MTHLLHCAKRRPKQIDHLLVWLQDLRAAFIPWRDQRFSTVTVAAEQEIYSLTQQWL
jgi:hypothetical protein